MSAIAPVGEDRIVLSNRMSELARAGSWLASWARGQSLPAIPLFAIRLCLEEALANIVTHGFTGGDHAIEVAIRREPGEVVLTIIDDGLPFDPLAAPPRPHAHDLASAMPGGHGVALMKSYADRLAYQRAEGWNRLMLGFSMAGERPARDR